MTRELKTWPEFYENILDGRKTFDIRENDRGFKVGDTLLLREYEITPEQYNRSPRTGYYTGRQLRVEVTYLTDFAQREGYVVMAIRRCYQPPVPIKQH